MANSQKKNTTKRVTLFFFSWRLTTFVFLMQNKLLVCIVNITAMLSQQKVETREQKLVFCSSFLFVNDSQKKNNFYEIGARKKNLLFGRIKNLLLISCLRKWGIRSGPLIKSIFIMFNISLFLFTGFITESHKLKIN